MNMIEKVEVAVRKEFWENNGSYRDVARIIYQLDIIIKLMKED